MFGKLSWVITDCSFALLKGYFSDILEVFPKKRKDPKRTSQ